jgi:hypothetical protein
MQPQPQHYRITDPHTGLCIRLHNAAAPGEPEHIVTRLVPLTDCTRFTTHRAARNAFAAHIGVAVLEIERVDA